MVVRFQRGFTLVEVILALSLSLMTVGAVYSLYSVQARTQVVQEDILDMQQNARAVIDLVSRELKMAGYDPMGVNHDQDPNNDFGGVTFNPTQLIINADLNGNGTPTDTNESIAFSHDPDSLTMRRDTGGGRQPLGEQIAAFELLYFDDAGKPTTESKDIRQVEIAITAQTARPDSQYPRHSGYRRWTLQSRVTPRNLGLWK